MKIALHTKRKKLRRLFIGAMSLIVMISSVTVAFVNHEEVLACGFPGQRTGYFHCRGIYTSPTFEVLIGGLPGSITTKQRFISHIEGLVNQGNYTSANNSSYNKLGAAYIIQTMRGGTDHGYPSASDITDWKARINNPSISVGWSNQKANINSARSPQRNGVRDIYSYYGDNVSYRSFTFYEGSAVRYIVKQSCGNPLGGLGLPVAPDPLDYTLDPVMNASPDSGEGGSTATLSPTVNNSGTTDSPADVAWQITSFNVPRGGTVPGGDSNAQAPTTHYGNGATVIQPPGTSRFIPGMNSINANPHTMGDLAVGTRVCYALSVSPYNQSTGTNWRHSPPDCVTIAKKPKVQVLGSDLIVGKGQTSNIVTSSTTKGIGGSNRTFGSWGEYGIITSGRVTSMASGAGYSGGATSNVFCGVSLLTFSNVSTGQTRCTSASQVGGYTNTRSLPDVGSRLNATSSLGASPTVNLANVGTGSYSATGNVSVSASGPIVRGKWVVINAPTATVTITGDINYTTDTLRSLSDIPQVVIIANQIRITGGVTNIDAWLIASGATGNLITCSDVATASQLTASNCNQRLTVNGPVMAKHLYLYRTAGAETGNQTGDPAEVFNLRPDAYLWATSYLSDAGRLQTVTTKELPPRF
jgi:hypothetical protein